MLIEQIIEFELRGPGSPGRTCTPIAGYFYSPIKVWDTSLLPQVVLFSSIKPISNSISLKSTAWSPDVR